jgi:hypothetical protein
MDKAQEASASDIKFVICAIQFGLVESSSLTCVCVCVCVCVCNAVAPSRVTSKFFGDELPFLCHFQRILATEM